MNKEKFEQYINTFIARFGNDKVKSILIDEAIRYNSNDVSNIWNDMKNSTMPEKYFDLSTDELTEEGFNIIYTQKCFNDDIKKMNINELIDYLFLYYKNSMDIISALTFIQAEIFND